MRNSEMRLVNGVGFSNGWALRLSEDIGVPPVARCRRAALDRERAAPCRRHPRGVLRSSGRDGPRADRFLPACQRSVRDQRRERLDPQSRDRRLRAARCPATSRAPPLGRWWAPARRRALGVALPEPDHLRPPAPHTPAAPGSTAGPSRAPLGGWCRVPRLHPDSCSQPTSAARWQSGILARDSDVPATQFERWIRPRRQAARPVLGEELHAPRRPRQWKECSPKHKADLRPPAGIGVHLKRLADLLSSTRHSGAEAGLAELKQQLRTLATEAVLPYTLALDSWWRTL